MVRAAALLIAIILCGPKLQDAEHDAEAEVRKSESAWANAIATKSLDQTIASYAPDAVTAGSAMFSAEGLAEFRNEWANIFARPGFSLSWKTERVAVTKSGTIAYTSGTWSSEGDTGPYLAVWQKQKDGSWKVVIDAAWQER